MYYIDGVKVKGKGNSIKLNKREKKKMEKAIKKLTGSSN
jgi:hypothetical protein